MMKEKRIFQHVSSKDICQGYELLLKRNLVHFPLTQAGRHQVDAIVANLSNSHFGEEIYKSIEEKVVAYLYFLIKDHPFTDGNKRTATITFLVLCQLNELDFQSNSFSALDKLAVLIEKITEKDHQLVISTIAKILFGDSTADSSMRYE